MRIRFSVFRHNRKEYIGVLIKLLDEEQEGSYRRRTTDIMKEWQKQIVELWLGQDSRFIKRIYKRRNSWEI